MYCQVLSTELVLKCADITPIFTKDDETDKSDYRHLSILPNLRKIYERFMQNQIYLSLNQTFWKYHCGIRERVQCSTLFSPSRPVVRLKVPQKINHFFSKMYLKGLFACKTLLRKLNPEFEKNKQHNKKTGFFAIWSLGSEDFLKVSFSDIDFFILT